MGFLKFIFPFNIYIYIYTEIFGVKQNIQNFDTRGVIVAGGRWSFFFTSGAFPNNRVPTAVYLINFLFFLFFFHF